VRLHFSDEIEVGYIAGALYYFNLFGQIPELGQTVPQVTYLLVTADVGLPEAV